eukprot:479404-Amphidinium_carterae.1
MHGSVQGIQGVTVGVVYMGCSCNAVTLLECVYHASWKEMQAEKENRPAKGPAGKKKKVFEEEEDHQLKSAREHELGMLRSAAPKTCSQQCSVNAIPHTTSPLDVMPFRAPMYRRRNSSMWRTRI